MESRSRFGVLAELTLLLTCNNVLIFIAFTDEQQALFCEPAQMSTNVKFALTDEFKSPILSMS